MLDMILPAGLIRALDGGLILGVRTKVKVKYSLSLAITLFIFCIYAPSANGQYETFVKKASIETADGIRFSGWINNHIIRRNQNTIVNFVIENRSPRTIYLAWRIGDLNTDVDRGFRLQMYPS